MTSVRLRVLVVTVVVVVAVSSALMFEALLSLGGPPPSGIRGMAMQPAGSASP